MVVHVLTILNLTLNLIGSQCRSCNEGIRDLVVVKAVHAQDGAIVPCLCLQVTNYNSQDTML